MGRVGKEDLHGSFLDDLSGVHNDDAGTHLSHNAEMVGDEEDAHALVLLAVDEVYRVCACCAAPAAVKLESRNFRVTCIDEPVIKILALVHIELVGVVVVADLDAVLLRNVAEAVEICCNFFSFCLVAEICRRADVRNRMAAVNGANGNS